MKMNANHIFMQVKVKCEFEQDVVIESTIP